MHNLYSDSVSEFYWTVCVLSRIFFGGGGFEPEGSAERTPTSET